MVINIWNGDGKLLVKSKQTPSRYCNNRLLGNDVHTAAADVKSTTCEPEPADFEKKEDYGFKVSWKESWRNNFFTE